jgi:hypothetical protein
VAPHEHTGGCQGTGTKYANTLNVLVSVGDPDPQDPHVLSLPDPDSDPLVRGTDPDPSPFP